jgi:hypothetical protein
MQVNEFVGQVQHGARHPKRKQALDSARATAGSPRQAVRAGENRDVLAVPPLKPSRFGSGF